LLSKVLSVSLCLHLQIYKPHDHTVHLSIDDHAEFHVGIKVYLLNWKCLLKVVSKKIPNV
jgi:hypothetical protein